MAVAYDWGNDLPQGRRARLRRFSSRHLPSTSISAPLTRLLRFALYFLFCLLLTVSVSAEIGTGRFAAYLQQTKLTLQDCQDHAPAELFALLQQRSGIHNSGTPGSAATNQDTFYRSYLDVLKPFNDDQHPDIARLRAELRSIYYHLTDAAGAILEHRSYVTHERVDAYVEHVISELAKSSSATYDDDLDLSLEDTATYLRIHLILVSSSSPVRKIDPDQFRTQFVQLVKKATIKGEFSVRWLYRDLLEFAEHYPDALETWR